MLTIRNEQMQAFGREALHQYERRMASHLRKTFPAETATRPESELAAAVRRGIAKARSYAVETEYDIRRYLEYTVIYGEEMDRSAEHAWIGEILRHDGWSGTTKMDRIDDGDLERVRAARARK